MVDPNKPEVWQLAIPSIDEALKYFQKLGIESIELKLTENMALPQVFRAADKLVHLGFQVTFHAPGRFRFPEDIQQQLENLSAVANFMHRRFRQRPIMVIHPLNSTTQSRSELILQTLDYLKQLLFFPGPIPACFALEILRNRADSEKTHSGDSYQEILEIIDNTGDRHLGICWDFGHANAMYQRGLQEKFPPPEFLDRVIHCHVHDCLNQRTHLPLGMGEVPIEKNIALLVEYGYNGILNLELAPHKIDEPENFLNYVEQSVGLLRRLIGHD